MTTEHVAKIQIGSREFTVSKDDERRVVRVYGELFNRRGYWLPRMEEQIGRALVDTGLPVECFSAFKMDHRAGAEWPYSRSQAVCLVREILWERAREDDCCQQLVTGMQLARKRHFLAKDLGLYRPDRALHGDHHRYLELWRDTVTALYKTVQHPYRWLADESLKGSPPVVSDPVGDYFFHPGPCEPTTKDLLWLREQLDKVHCRLVQWESKTS